MYLKQLVYCSEYHLDVSNDHESHKDVWGEHRYGETESVPTPSSISVANLVAYSSQAVSAQQDEGWEREKVEIYGQTRNNWESILDEVG